jgi:NAD(P)-dependent dehydrogenase (short-subunit alcohol dehydrogenase family)
MHVRAERSQTGPDMNIVIVGCGNVGFETARMLCRDHRLLLASRSQPPDIADFVRDHENVSFVPVDATDAPSMERAIAAFCDRFGPLDVFICTVGASCAVSAVDDFAKCKSDFTLNFFGNIVPAGVALSHMIPTHAGKIVVLSSTSGVFTYPGMTAYSPAKWAITGLFQTLAKEIEPLGISVTVLFPASIKNSRSRTFLYETGIDARSVAARIASSLQRKRSAICFIPRRYVLLKSLEQSFPWILDKRARLHSRRRHRFRSWQIDSALIIGASSSLGAELARLYSNRVKRLYLVEHDTASASPTEDGIGDSCACLVSAVRINTGDDQAIADFSHRLATVDLVISVGCSLPDKEAIDLSRADRERDLETNFYGPVQLIAMLLRRSERPRKIVNVLSTRTLPGRLGRTGCTGGQSAMWAFTRSLRRTYGNEIQVTEVLLATRWASHKCTADSCTKVDSEPWRAAGAPCRVPTKLGIASRQIADRIQRAEQTGEEIVRIAIRAGAGTHTGTM